MLSYGLRADQVQAFFAPEDPNLPPALNTSLRYNRAFGTPGIVNLTFGVNGETVTAIKNVVYWPQLNYPGAAAEQEPDARRFGGSHGSEDSVLQPTATTSPATPISVYRSRTEHLDHPRRQAVRRAELQGRRRELPDPRLQRRHGFVRYARRRSRADSLLLLHVAGQVRPRAAVQRAEPDPMGGTLHDRQRMAAAHEARRTCPTGGEIVTIWLVTHDERAGTDWASRTFLLLPRRAGQSSAARTRYRRRPAPRRPRTYCRSP